MAADTLPELDVLLMCKLAVGAAVMRGAGCTINDLWDRDIDGKVTRTASRPIAAGTVSVPRALGFLGLQLSAGLGVLLSLHQTAIGVALLSVPLITVYPLMKRVFDWPQLVLGLSFGFGALVGYPAAASQAGHIDLSVVAPLYVSCVLWTIMYDTIYAHQDKDDDAALQLKSTALWMGENTKYWLYGLSAASSVCLAVAGSAAGLGVPFLVVSVCGGLAHLLRQVQSVDLYNGPDCMQKFISNRDYGLLVVFGILLDRAMLMI